MHVQALAHVTTYHCVDKGGIVSCLWTAQSYHTLLCISISISQNFIVRLLFAAAVAAAAAAAAAAEACGRQQCAGDCSRKRAMICASQSIKACLLSDASRRSVISQRTHAARALALHPSIPPSTPRILQKSTHPARRSRTAGLEITVPNQLQSPALPTELSRVSVHDELRCRAPPHSRAPATSTGGSFLLPRAPVSPPGAEPHG